MDVAALNAGSVTGTWSWGRDGRPYCVLRVLEKRESARFQIECDGGAPVHNRGRIDGEVPVREGLGLFVRQEGGFRCEIDFEFHDEKAVLRQKGGDADCGLGLNVLVGGTYSGTSRKPPMFVPEP